MNELFNQLFKEVFDSISELKNLDGFDIKTEKIPNGIIISAEYKPQLKEDKELSEFVKNFEDYVKNVDDFIFEEAVETFNEVSDIKLSEFQKIISDKKDKENIMKYGECFMNCVKAVARDFIDELTEKYKLNS